MRPKKETADLSLIGQYQRGVRTPETRAANREARTKWLANRKAPKVHGTIATYINYGCRCRECREAKAVDARKRYHKTHPDARYYERKTPAPEGAIMVPPEVTNPESTT